MIGYLSAVLYCLMTAISILKIHHITQNADPTVVMLYTFAICIVFFNVINIFNLKNIYSALSGNLTATFWVNLTTASTWLTTFWGLKLINPALFVTIVMGILPIISLTIAMITEKAFSLIACMTALSIAILISIIIISSKDLSAASDTHYILGVIIAIISGASFSLYMKYSKLLHSNSKLLPSQLLCVRFYSVILIGALLSLIPFDSHKYFSNIHLPTIMIIALFSSILPLYFLQTSIHRIGPIKTAYILPFTPVFTYVLQLFYGVPFNILHFSLLLLLSIVLSISVLVKI